MLVAVAIVFVAALYLTGLTRMGMYSTDEPRYAAIGQAMAQSGDWVTPRLWGQPWFEKPALLYWMTATGFKLGLGPDLAPRLPVAFLSVAFLFLFFKRLSQVFGREIANYSVAMLATSAGWLAYSHVAVTDLPLSAFFSLAVVWSLPVESPMEGRVEGEHRRTARIVAAVALGLAFMAKGLPPLVLFLPVLALDYREWRRWLADWPIVAFCTVALPWYVWCTVRNGWGFPEVFFVQHQFDRFRTDALQHAQKWWFYGPYFLLLLFPWFPLLPLALRGGKEDRRVPMLAAVVGFGFVFFSAAVNKLPGYVLPLVPATCVLMGIGLARVSRRERWLIAPIVCLGALPVAVSVLGGAGGNSWRPAQIPWGLAAMGLLSGLAVGAAIALEWRSRSFPPVVMVAAAVFLWVEIGIFPLLDKAGSGRSVWIADHPSCAPVLPRNLLYGLYYYSGKPLPNCAIVDKNANPLYGSEPTK